MIRIKYPNSRHNFKIVLQYCDVHQQRLVIDFCKYEISGAGPGIRVLLVSSRSRSKNTDIVGPQVRSVQQWLKCLRVQLSTSTHISK